MKSTLDEPLEKLGNLRSGYSARRKMDTDPELSTYWSISVRTICGEFPFRIDWSKLEPIEFEGDESRYLLKDGDILISVRGIFYAVLINKPSANVIVMNNWTIFSPNENLSGRYFAWWFNHPKTQRSLEKFSSFGKVTSFLSMSQLKNLSVPLPSLERQRQIVELHELRQREKELTRMLEKKREVLINTLTFKLIDIEEN